MFSVQKYSYFNVILFEKYSYFKMFPLGKYHYFSIIASKVLTKSTKENYKQEKAVTF